LRPERQKRTGRERRQRTPQRRVQQGERSPLAPAAALAERGASGHLNIIYWQAPSILNPYLSGGTKDIEAASLVIEPLARFDQTADGALARRRDPDCRKRRCLRRPDLDHLEASPKA
jgi:hypothetical protein